MTSKVLICAWIAILTILAFYFAMRPEIVRRWMLRDSQTVLGRSLHLQDRLMSNSYLQRTRAIFVIMGIIGTAMFLVFVFATVRPH